MKVMGYSQSITVVALSPGRITPPGLFFCHAFRPSAIIICVSHIFVDSVMCITHIHLTNTEATALEDEMCNEAIIAELNARLDASKRIDAEGDKIAERIYGAGLAENRFLVRVPVVVCADGLTMSVQASVHHYCSPRHSVGPWTSVEIGFPSERVEALMPYIDGEDSEPTDTVYGYVPISVVADVIASHGGFAA